MSQPSSASSLPFPRLSNVETAGSDITISSWGILPHSLAGGDGRGPPTGGGVAGALRPGAFAPRFSRQSPNLPCRRQKKAARPELFSFFYLPLWMRRGQADRLQVDNSRLVQAMLACGSVPSLSSHPRPRSFPPSLPLSTPAASPLTSPTHSHNTTHPATPRHAQRTTASQASRSSPR